MPKILNNSKRRRLAKAARHVRGNSGRPDPSGNREYRRSPTAKAERRQMLEKLALR